MKYFLSHCEYIERAARSAAELAGVYLQGDIVRLTIEALGNIQLAYEEEIPPNPALVQCSDLYMRLLKAGACDDGLTVVGHQCDEDTLDRVFAHRLDWQRWYEDNIDAEACDYEDEPYPHFDTPDEVNA